MLIKNFAPQAALAEFIRYYQVVHLTFPESAVIPFKAFAPRPENCLCFYPANPESLEFQGSGKLNRLNRAEVMGQHLTVTNRHVGKEFLVIRVIFQPGALYRLTGIPSYELTNTHVDAEAIFSTDLQSVNRRLSGTRRYPEIFEIIESFLLGAVTKAKFGFHAVDHAGGMLLLKKGHLSMDVLANEVCLSPRQLMRKFNQRMGISPSIFSRVARFDKSLELKNTNSSKKWFDIALESGYYDYQHMVKDYKDFTGITPEAFLVEDHRSPENALASSEE